MDPITIAATSAVLTEGIKFVYAQISELFKRRRQIESDLQDESLTIEVKDEHLDSKIEPVTISTRDLDKLSPTLRDVRHRLADYLDGLEAIDTSDAELIRLVSSARSALEGLYGINLTLRGEHGRPKSGTPAAQADSPALGAASASGLGTVAAARISRSQTATNRGVAIGGNVHGNVATGDEKTG